jgi:hypothetical protein
MPIVIEVHEQIVRRRAGVGSAGRHRLVADQPMRARGDFLGKPAGAAADDDDPFGSRLGIHRFRRLSFSAALDRTSRVYAD